MVERVASREPGAEKRRTSRLEQKVPLTVNGQDALGQPFTERTSTVAVNCHGCMFVSSHYLLKDARLTLNVVSAATGEHKVANAKVIRAQKPAQPGDVFRIAAALDEPGNIWGITFPPKDWSPYLGEKESAVEAPAAEAAPPPPAAPPAEKEEQAYELAEAEEPGAVKRRSTRIVQSVPLTVIGVNALGQGFKERTSTLIVNCHGCKYASKHYVLKNSWLTLEVPHPQPDQPPRRARGRVTYVQRPRTVRELFQIGVELEVPGNFWGIAFPPPDWFPWSEQGQVPEIPADAHAPAIEAPRPAAAPPPAESKVRAFPPPAAQEVARLASQQMGKLLAEARQQLQTAAREAASTAVAAETGQLLREVNRQLEIAAQQAVQNAAAAFTDELVRRTTAQLRDVRQNLSQEMREQLTRNFTGELESAREQLLQQLETAGETFRSKYTASLESELKAAGERARAIQEKIAARAKAASEQLEQQEAGQQGRIQALAASEQRVEELRASLASAANSAEERLREFANALESQSAQKRAEFQGASEQLSRESAERLEAARGQFAELAAKFQQTAEAMNQQLQGTLEQHTGESLDRLSGKLKEFEDVAQKLRENFVADSQQVHADLRERLGDDLTTAALQWNERVQDSVERAAERLTTRVRGISRGAADQAEKEFRARAEAVRQSIEGRLAETQRSLEELRVTMTADLERASATHAQVNQVKQEVDELTAHLDSLTRSTMATLEHRLEEAFAARAAGLDRRADEIISTLPERMQPVVEAAEQVATGRLIARIEGQLAVPLHRAEETIEKLAAGQAALSEAIRAQREQIRLAAEEAIREGSSLMQSTVEQLRQDFDRAARESQARWLEELDEKATEANHTTFEALYKAADWYQKKAQTSMQAALDKLLQQSGDQMRGKAGEISRLFAQELDHYSRSYVEHAQGLMEEASREVVGRGREQLTTAADATSAHFGDEVQRVATERLEAVAETARKTFEETSRQLDAHASAARSQLQHDAAVTRAQSEEQEAAGRARIRDAAKTAVEGMEARRGESFDAFAQQLAARIDAEIERAEHELATAMVPVFSSWREERETQQREWRENLARISSENIEQYKQRLEGASNSWMLTTAATLNQQAQGMVESAAQGAERRLRETSAGVLASLADTFRERLLKLSTEFGAGSKPQDQEKK